MTNNKTNRATRILNIEATDRHFRDLLLRLIEHTWFTYLYVITLITLTYVLGLWVSTSLLFLFIQLPTLAIVTYVISANPKFRWKVPFIWVLTALMVWSYNSPPDRIPEQIKAEILPTCVILLFFYWLIRSIMNSSHEFRGTKAEGSFTEAMAELLSAWGATLQLAIILLLPVKLLFLTTFAQASTGQYLVRLLETLRLSSPLSWAPIGILLLGLMLFIVLKFSERPYVARDYMSVLTFNLRPGVNEILAAIRLPVWLLIVAIEFVKHFIMLAWYTFEVFSVRWLGRFALILLALVFPVVTLIGGHISFYKGMAMLSGYLTSAGPTLWSGVIAYLAINGLALLALTLYVSAIGPIAMEVGSVPVLSIFRTVREYLRKEGFGAAQAVGKSFSPYGLVVLAVPLASLLPGGTRWGIFSTLYASVIFLLTIVYFAWDRLSPKEQEEKIDRMRSFLLNAFSVLHLAGREEATRDDAGQFDRRQSVGRDPESSPSESDLRDAQLVDDSPETGEMPLNVCQANVGSGEPCSRPAAQGGRYCWQHEPRKG